MNKYIKLFEDFDSALYTSLKNELETKKKLRDTKLKALKKEYSLKIDQLKNELNLKEKEILKETQPEIDSIKSEVDSMYINSKKELVYIMNNYFEMYSDYSNRYDIVYATENPTYWAPGCESVLFNNDFINNLKKINKKINELGFTMYVRFSNPDFSFNKLYKDLTNKGSVVVNYMLVYYADFNEVISKDLSKIMNTQIQFLVCVQMKKKGRRNE